MQRLIYSPRVYAFIKTQDYGTIEVTDDIVRGTVNRRVNQVSQATLELRNDKRKWTENQGVPVFRPMDPITVYMSRFEEYPVQVFTGFLDKTPYYQFYPGTVSLEASCTLKRLLYTHWDPALPFVNEFISSVGGGWVTNRSTGELQNLNALVDPATQNPDSSLPKLNDGSIGNLLFQVMTRAGHWDKGTVWIENLPKDIYEHVAEIFNSFNEEVDNSIDGLKELVRKTIGAGSYGDGKPDPVTSSGPVAGMNEIVPIIKKVAETHNLPPVFVMAVCDIESSYGQHLHTSGSSYYGWFQQSIDPKTPPYGFLGKETPTQDEANDLAQSCDLFCRAARAKLGSGHDSLIKEANWYTWAINIQGVQNNVSTQGPGYNPPSSFTAFVERAKSYYSSYKGSPLPPNQALDNIENTKAKRKSDKKTPGADPQTDIHAPIQGGTTKFGRGWHQATTGGPIEQTTTSGHLHWHSGQDVPVAAGTPCIAPADGKITLAQAIWSDGGMVHFTFTQDVGDIKSGTVIGWGHVQGIKVKVGDRVRAGQTLALSGNPGGGPHVHFIQRNDSTAADGSVDPLDLLSALQQGKTTPTKGGAISDTDSQGTSFNVLNAAKASAFAASFAFPSAAEQLEATLLTGDRSLMNDQPLLPFIQQLTEGSMRHFQSLPNGNFYAFFPDYFGSFNHRKPYWEIDDIEILDGKIELSDDNLVTHMYVVGDTVLPNGQIDFFEKLTARGVVTLNNSAITSWVSGGHNTPLFNGKTDVLGFLERYGARPLFEPAPFVRSSYFEIFLAWQRFMQAWARQFLTTFSFTFMPEIFPGGLVSFPSHGIQCYVEEVQHSFDYEAGFTTEANLSSPAALAHNNNPVSQGLVLSGEAQSALPNTIILRDNTE